MDAVLQTERTIYRLNLIAILATELMKSRQHQFRGLGFDPDAHLMSDEGGMLDWTDEAPAQVKTWCYELFNGRNEDGKRETTPPPRPARRRPVAAAR